MQVEQYHILWKGCLDVIKDNVSEAVFDTWFKPIVPLSYKDNEFTIQVPTQFFYERLEGTFADLLNRVLKRVVGNGNVKLFYSVGVAGKSNKDVILPAGNEAVYPKTEQNADIPNLFASKARQDWDSHLIAKYNFDNYFEGVSNRAVRSSSETIAKEPGKTLFNPMFVYGASGVGKTHLCHAIGNRIQEIHPEKRVLYVSAHLFTIQYTEAVRKNTLNDFMYFYQGVDVLILDDIQELIGKDKTQNTFFHIFNHLHLLGKQLILTSDKAPVDLQGMEERLVTRLKWGVTLEMERPDLDLRKKILKNKISHDGVEIPEDVFDFIASNVTENVRDVEGIVASLLAHSTAFNRPIDLPLAKQVISRVIKIEKKQVSVESIMDIVCKYYNLEQSVIQTNSRKREIVQARQITMFLAKNYTESSLSHIGKIVGKRDHATVLHACKTVKDQIETNKSFRSSVEEIEALLKA
ncbi:MAG: chromosomal replication initiator protein DnaA [Parabacteroides sp.]|nr:chromosomal replication initiator protein DnaA [Parabacteroides sp.]MBR2497101.1 chromosomal replication initiator protein DnaA [Parabacteroides sp.]